MKSVADVLEYIDHFYSQVIARPACYASSPRALEDIVLTLEELRGFILEDSGEGRAFTDFTLALGIGVTGICHDPGTPEFQKEEEVQLFLRVAGVLRQFLEQQKRLQVSVAPPVERTNHSGQ